MSAAPTDDPSTQRLLDRLTGGDRAALDELLTRHRGAMRDLIDRRLDGRLRGRVDPSDVVQEAQLEAARRIDDYLARRPMPFRVWLYRTAHEHLLRQRRRHLGADCRAADREQVLPEHSTVLLANRLLAAPDTGSRRLLRAELLEQVQRALAQLAETDREVLLLRVFEGLSNQEVAQVLDLEADAASKRYGRALLRLRQVLAGFDVSGPQG